MPFAEILMDLEAVIQSEVIQKEKNKYCILMQTCEIQKNGTDELICKAETETDLDNKLMDTGRWGNGVGVDCEIGADMYTTMYKQITNTALGTLLSAPR